MGNSKQLTWRALGALFALASAAIATADEHSPAVSASLALGSDITFRGVSQTLGDAAVEAYADVAFESGVYGYVWGSNVDFMPDNEPDDGATYEIDAAVGYVHDLGDRWYVDVMLVHYIFPGTKPGADYDYTELVTTLWLDDRHFAAVGYSNDVFGAAADGLYYSIGTSIELPLELTLSTELGYYDLDEAYGAGYGFAGATLSRTFGPVHASLSYVDTSTSARDIFFAQSVGPRYVLSLGFDLVTPK